MVILNDFKPARVWVAGDIMLDKYWHGPVQRISPEAPVPVVHIEKEQLRAGGAGNVAINLAQLGCRTHLFSLLGQDEAALKLQSILQKAGVHHHRLHIPQPTITKLRVISQQQLIRLDFEKKIDAEFSQALYQLYAQQKGYAEVLILSDYGKGSLADPQKWIQTAIKKNQKVLVDPKGRDFSIYRGAYCLTPNLAEFEAVAGRCSHLSRLEKAALNMVKDLQLDHLLITRGEQGMSWFSAQGEAHHLPTEAEEVFDVTGAGDTVIATLAAALAAGQNMAAATALANLAAGIVVAKLGTASVSPEDIKKKLWQQRLDEHGIVDQNRLFELVAAARERGESIVMTNGCFDLLHAGHVLYLKQAAELGDRLIVAVNTDEQVRRLKGPDRPINGLAERMQVLAALSFVDWVVPFSEATPKNLICRIKPDLLVKGGDNDPNRIPGGDCVRQAGGQVKVLSYLKGISTTELVNRIKQ